MMDIDTSVDLGIVSASATGTDVIETVTVADSRLANWPLILLICAAVAVGAYIARG